MAVPNSGNELSLLGIRREVGANNYNSSNTYTDISLEDLSEGTVDALNTANNSSNMPDGSEPHAMSEWYSYDHDLTGIATPTNLNVSATQTATIAGLSFDVNDSTDRIYAFLRNDGILGNGTTYEDAQIYVPASVGAGLTAGYVDTSAGAATYSIFFGLGDPDDFTVVGTNFNVGAANDFVTLYLKGSNNGSTFTSQTSDITLSFTPATPTSLSTDRIQNNQFTASFDDPHDTNPAGKYLLWLGQSTTRTSNTEYAVNGASSAGDSLEWYSLDEVTLNANTNYYWWIASSGSYGNGVSSYSSMQSFTTSNVSLGGGVTSEDFTATAGGSITYSSARNFSITNIPTSGHKGNLTIDITSVLKNSGTLSMAWSLIGDPGTAGNDNFGSGWLNEDQTVARIATIVGSDVDTDQNGTQVFYYRLRYSPYSSAVSQDDRTITVSFHGASESATVGVTTTGGKSDRRLKTNIDLIGHSKHFQIPIYTFNYKEDLSTTYKGVMAQDLLEMNFNHAVVIDKDGYYNVLYDLIDVDMETLN